jgi:GAF domain-containing protein
MVIMAEKVTHQEVSNMRHVLSLLRNQLKAGRVDGDYMLRQFDKIEDLIDRFTSMQIEQKSAGRFEALYNVSAMIGASLDIDKVLEHIMDAVIQLTGAERGFLMLRDDDGDLQVRIARNLDQQTLTSADFEYSRTIASHVLDTGEAVVTTNAAEDSRFAGQASIVSRALRSIMVAPLRARGRVIGIAYVENRIVAGLFGEEDLATLETLMAQASVAVDNAHAL